MSSSARGGVRGSSLAPVTTTTTTSHTTTTTTSVRTSTTTADPTSLARGLTFPREGFAFHDGQLVPVLAGLKPDEVWAARMASRPQRPAEETQAVSQAPCGMTAQELMELVQRAADITAEDLAPAGQDGHDAATHQWLAASQQKLKNAKLYFKLPVTDKNYAENLTQVDRAEEMLAQLKTLERVGGRPANAADLANRAAWDVALGRTTIKTYGELLPATVQSERH